MTTTPSTPVLPPRRARLALRIAVAVVGLGTVAAGAISGYGVWVLHASRPMLDGTLALPGLDAPSRSPATAKASPR